MKGENTPQFYCICGKGDKSSIRILKHGLSIKEQVFLFITKGIIIV